MSTTHTYCRVPSARAIVATMIHRCASLALCLALLSGCATYSTDECEGGDWTEIGEKDGRDGRKADKFDLHAKACKLDRSEVSRAAYMAGRDSGLKAYCVDAHGYREGTLGQEYLGTCPAALEPAFLKGYRLGQQIYKAESQQSDISDALRSAKTEQDKQRLEAENAKVKAELRALRAQGDALVLAARRKKPF